MSQFHCLRGYQGQPNIHFASLSSSSRVGVLYNANRGERGRADMAVFGVC